MPIKSKEDKIQIRVFKDQSSNWWVGDAHYYLNASEELIWCSGEVDKPELREALLAFIKRNKKCHVPTPPSVFETEEKEYSKIGFGKHSGKSTLDILSEDKKWLSWMYKNYSFKSGEEKLKQEIKELLKIK